MDIPWEQLSQLGVGGLFTVIILWMTFRFLNNRRNGIEEILLKMDASESKMASALESIAKAVNNQTSLIQIISERQHDLHLELVRGDNNGSIRRRGSEVPKGTQ